MRPINPMADLKIMGKAVLIALFLGMAWKILFVL